MSNSPRSKRKWLPWVLDKAIDNWQGIFTVFIGGGGMTFLASITSFLDPYGPVAYGAIGILSMLLISIALYLYGLYKEKTTTAKYLSKKIDADLVNVLASSHNKERINLIDFYHPYFKPIENVQFEDCDLFGPAYVASDGGNFSGCDFIDCEITIVRGDRPIKGAVLFKLSSFVRCNFFRMTWVMNIDTYNALPQEMKRGVPVISDGRIGDV